MRKVSGKICRALRRDELPSRTDDDLCRYCMAMEKEPDDFWEVYASERRRYGKAMVGHYVRRF